MRLRLVSREEAVTKLARDAIALVWLYNGHWCNLLGGCPLHAAIVASVPAVGPFGGEGFRRGCVDTHGDHGFLAIALAQTEGLRPAFLPRLFGQEFFLSGYRIFTRFDTRSGHAPA